MEHGPECSYLRTCVYRIYLVRRTTFKTSWVYHCRKIRFNLTHAVYHLVGNSIVTGSLVANSRYSLACSHFTYTIKYFYVWKCRWVEEIVLFLTFWKYLHYVMHRVAKVCKSFGPRVWQPNFHQGRRVDKIRNDISMNMWNYASC